jgi:hypothetical protein
MLQFIKIKKNKNKKNKHVTYVGLQGERELGAALQAGFWLAGISNVYLLCA